MTIVVDSTWRQCTRAHPCPGCGHSHWCAYSADGAFVCMRPETATIPAGYRKILTRDDDGVIFAPDDGRSRNGHHRGNGRASKPGKPSPYQSREAAIEAARRSVANSEAVAIDDVSHAGEWFYHDAGGAEAFRVWRFDYPGSKQCRPAYQSGDGWRLGYPPGPRVLYRLSELLAADAGALVFIVEGEKCADALAACGVLVTTSAGGCKSASKTDWTPLGGRRVVLLPDFDGPGDEYAADVDRLLRGNA